MICAHVRAVLKAECRFRFSACAFVSARHIVFFCFSLDYFVFVSFAFVALGLISSVLCLQCFDTVGWVAGRASGL